MPIKLPFRPRRDTYPPDLWTKCPSCEEMIFNRQLDKALRVCPNCGHHFRLGAQARLDLLLDRATFEERDSDLQSVDRLGFVDQKAYADRIVAAQIATGLRDAAVWGTGRIGGRALVMVVMDFGFMGGSMGAVVGEKITRAAEAARESSLPLVIVSASGGARMQEGTFALMQLAKTVAAIERLRSAGLPFISVLTDPTTGGVWASFAALGDVNLAEPDAQIGFAGARVQAGTIAQELPAGFQRAEFLFKHGFVDRVVQRSEMRDEIRRILAYLAPAGSSEAEPPASSGGFHPLAGLRSALGEKAAPAPEPSNGAIALGGRAPRGSGRAPRGSGRSSPPEASHEGSETPIPATGARSVPVDAPAGPVGATDDPHG